MVQSTCHNYWYDVLMENDTLARGNAQGRHDRTVKNIFQNMLMMIVMMMMRQCSLSHQQLMTFCLKKSRFAQVRNQRTMKVKGKSHGLCHTLKTKPDANLKDMYVLYFFVQYKQYYWWHTTWLKTANSSADITLTAPNFYNLWMTSAKHRKNSTRQLAYQPV